MLGRTCLAFNAVLIVHLCLVAYIRFHGRAGSLQIAPAFSWIVPVVFWFSTMTYFYHYVTIARLAAVVLVQFCVSIHLFNIVL
ncbi:hypothetical protein HU200_067135 [Digitaria exilis]|uniref:Uncharacterized protein n=1 Tax=Digitaria exilis TaxID=1010633 RepID=A0A834ZWY5_9POAL|nr:hypothetical protein HU200_067135 [Digitaria exilis]